MNKSVEEDKINEFFIKCFNNILQEEERKLQSIAKNLSINEFHIIEAIHKFDNATGKIVAKHLGITHGSLTVAVNTLEKKGYVNKIQDEVDRRIIRLSLTELGLKVNEEHKDFHVNMVKGIVKNCNKRELIILTKSLEKINKFFMEQKDENTNYNR